MVFAIVSKVCYDMQAAQVRKSNYVPQLAQDYHPDKDSFCTVYAGTSVQQVGPCKTQAHIRRRLPAYISHLS